MNPGGLIPILVPLSAMLLAGVIVGLTYWFRDRANQHRFKLLQSMVEKGVPIPPELIAPPARPLRTNRLLKWGLIDVAIGLALMIGHFEVHHLPLFVALIPLFIGAAMLISYRLERPR